MKAIGMVEVSGTVGAIDALDIMCKAANVSLLTWERKLGGRLVTVIVTGSISDVTAAVENAVHNGIVTPCAYAVIANPHRETQRILMNSAATHKILTQNN